MTMRLWPGNIAAAIALAGVSLFEGAKMGEAMPPMGEGGLEFWRYLATQSGLLVALLILGWSYRREFLRKIAEKDAVALERKAETDRAYEVIEATTAALTSTAVATARQSDATHRLARAVEQLERRTPDASRSR